MRSPRCRFEAIARARYVLFLAGESDSATWAIAGAGPLHGKRQSGRAAFAGQAPTARDAS